MGGGGFVAGPAGLAAVTARTPLVLTEADSHLGLANRLLAGRARRVCLAFPIAGREGDRYLRHRPPGSRRGAGRRSRCGTGALRDPVGRALPAGHGRQPGRPLGQPRRDRGLRRARGRATSTSSTWLAAATTTSSAQRLAAASHAEGYTLIAYEPDLGDVLAACDLVLARSGGSIFEITAAGRPAILVPYPYATADHQSANAAWMAEAGAAEVIEDAALSAELLDRSIGDLLDDVERLAAMSAASTTLARPDAARAIADQVLAAASGAPYTDIDHKRRTAT